MRKINLIHIFVVAFFGAASALALSLMGCSYSPPWTEIAGGSSEGAIFKLDADTQESSFVILATIAEPAELLRFQKESAPHISAPPPGSLDIVYDSDQQGVWVVMDDCEGNELDLVPDSAYPFDVPLSDFLKDCEEGRPCEWMKCIHFSSESGSPAEAPWSVEMVFGTYFDEYFEEPWSLTDIQILIQPMGVGE